MQVYLIIFLVVEVLIFVELSSEEFSKNQEPNENKNTRKTVGVKTFTVKKSQARTKRMIGPTLEYKLIEKKTEGKGGLVVKSYVERSGILNSFQNVSHWAEKEEALFISAKKRLPMLRDEIQMLKIYVKDYERTEQNIGQISASANANERGKLVASNAIASYQMTHRYIQILQRLKEIMALNFMETDVYEILWNTSHQNCGSIMKQFQAREAGSVLPDWPSRFDLMVAMHSIINIQEFYKYDYKDLPNALAPETWRPPQLTAFHSAEVGMYALYAKHYAVSIELLEDSIKKYNHKTNSSLSLPALESNLQLAAATHNVMMLGEDFSTLSSPQHFFRKKYKPFENTARKKERVSTYQLKLFGGKRNSLKAADVNYRGICYGADYRTIKEISRLNCWYDTNSSPGRQIMPYKKERLSFEPEVIQVYDFIGDKMISRIVNDKTNCQWMSTNSEVFSFNVMMRKRGSSTCYPRDMELLWKKLATLTLTDLTSEESFVPLLALEYLFGRLHSVHLDNIDSGTSEFQLSLAESYRIYSVIFYLNDVKVGGVTPFPTTGTAALPVKGSVILWKNLYRNGSERFDSVHAGCPLIYGFKQIALALIYSKAQFLTHPCTLDRHTETRNTQKEPQDENSNVAV